MEAFEQYKLAKRSQDGFGSDAYSHIGIKDVEDVVFLVQGKRV